MKNNVTLLHQQYVSLVADEVWQTSIVFTRKQPQGNIFTILLSTLGYFWHCCFCQSLPYKVCLIFYETSEKQNIRVTLFQRNELHVLVERLNRKKQN